MPVVSWGMTPRDDALPTSRRRRGPEAIRILDEKQVQQVEQQLRQIAGVASVVIDHTGGEIEAIHVLAQSDRRPKHIVRDIITAFRTLFKLPLDHKKVSVVMLDGPGGAGSPRKVDRVPKVQEPDDDVEVREARVGVQSITIRDFGYESEAEVVLVYQGREAMGLARGSGAGVRCARLMSLATARALERFLDARYRIDVGDVKLVSFGSRRAILVTISILAGRNEFLLLGSCWAFDDLRRTAVYATLDAINRAFGRLDRRKHVDYEVGPASPVTEPSEAIGDD